MYISYTRRLWEGVLSFVAESCKICLAAIGIFSAVFSLFVFFGDGVEEMRSAKRYYAANSPESLLVMYSRENCYSCRTQKHKLEEAQVAYHEVSIDDFGCVAKDPYSTLPTSCIPGKSLASMATSISKAPPRRGGGAQALMGILH